MTWRRRAVLGLGGVWALVGLARLSRLVEPPEPRPGDELGTFLDFLKTTIPVDAGYLYVLPGAFGTDTGAAPRLRYELFPRHYDDVRVGPDAARPTSGDANQISGGKTEPEVRRLMAAERLGFVVVPDASAYAEGSWLRQPRDWLRRIEVDANRYVLSVVS